MSLTALDNLVRIGKLKAEPRNEAELRRLMVVAQTSLSDATIPELSAQGRFGRAYTAAHASALAALRWHGYRSENRYTVFQSLAHTLDWPASAWRVLDTAHQKRNLMEYEGIGDLHEADIVELVAVAKDLLADVNRMITPA
jgi:hypothetical protein